MSDNKKPVEPIEADIASRCAACELEYATGSQYVNHTCEAPVAPSRRAAPPTRIERDQARGIKPPVTWDEASAAPPSEREAARVAHQEFVNLYPNQKNGFPSFHAGAAWGRSLPTDEGHLVSSDRIAWTGKPYTRLGEALINANVGAWYETACYWRECAEKAIAEARAAVPQAAAQRTPSNESLRKIADQLTEQLQPLYCSMSPAPLEQIRGIITCALLDLANDEYGQAWEFFNKTRAAAVPAPGPEELNCLSDLVDDCTRTIGVIDGVCSRLTEAKLLDAVVRLLMERSVSLTKSRDKFLQTALKESVAGATAPPKEG